jgi:hypothetical protein
MLTLAEEYFLLSIDDDKGKVIAAVSDGLNLGLAGALLADLALHGKIGLSDKRLSVLDAAPTGEALLDEALASMAAEKRQRKAGYWIERFGNKKLARKVSERLAEKNVLRIEKKRYLWVIPFEVYPQVDASAKYWVKQHLRSAVLAGGEATPGIIGLLSLLKACRLLDLVFTRDEAKAANRKVSELVNGEAFGKAVAEVIAEIEAAAAAAVVVVVVAGASSS